MIEITMENGKTIRIELDAEAAPITVENFTKLVKQGFYDGLTFHRIIPGFMIQGGCPEGTGMGGPGYGIKGEFAANGVENPIRHTRGVISMARSQMPNSAGSQFLHHACRRAASGRQLRRFRPCGGRHGRRRRDRVRRHGFPRQAPNARCDEVCEGRGLRCACLKNCSRFSGTGAC